MFLYLLKKITAYVKQPATLYAFEMKMIVACSILTLVLIACPDALLYIILTKKAFIRKLLHISIDGRSSNLIAFILQVVCNLINGDMSILTLFQVIQYDFPLLCAVCTLFVILHIYVLQNNTY